MKFHRTGIGIVGAGNISDQYLGNLTRFPDLEVLFIADLNLERAASQAAKWGVPASGTVDQMLANPEISLVVNLTIPSSHVEISLKSLEAGKHVWSEKPMALDRPGGLELLKAARENNVRIAIAPDTFLGAGIQTGLKSIRSGVLGKPLTALTIFQTAGPDSWHPNPAFLFAKGAGPLFDMGPYYITTLVQIFGKATRVNATSSRPRTSRVVGSGDERGTIFPVEEPTQVSALIEFASGASAVSIFSFEKAIERTGVVEVSGLNGDLILPDPNNFTGDNLIFPTLGEKILIPPRGNVDGRGLGVLNLAQSIFFGEREVAPGELGFHVLDILISISESAQNKCGVEVTSNWDGSPSLRDDWDPMIAICTK